MRLRPHLQTLAAILFWIAATKSAGAQQPVIQDLLMVGNSYTKANNVGRMLTEVLRSQRYPVQIERCSSGGYTLLRHSRTSTHQSQFGTRDWDITILQDQSVQPLVNRQDFVNGIQAIRQQLRKGPQHRLILWMTWPRKHIPEMLEGSKSESYARRLHEQRRKGSSNFERWIEPRRPVVEAGLMKTFRQVADECSAEVSPVGLGWKLALESLPDIDLYQEDGSHPTPIGSYLSACVLAATITQKSPEGCVCSVNGIQQNELTQLQKAAWRAVKSWKQSPPVQQD